MVSCPVRHGGDDFRGQSKAKQNDTTWRRNLQVNWITTLTIRLKFLADDTQGTARAVTNQTKFLRFRIRKRSTQGESLVSDRILNWPHTGFFTRRNWSATVVADNVARAATYRPTTHSHQVNKRSVLVTRSHHNLFTSLSHKLTWNQIKLTPLMCC